MCFSIQHIDSSYLVWQLGHYQESKLIMETNDKTNNLSDKDKVKCVGTTHLTLIKVCSICSSHCFIPLLINILLSFFHPHSSLYCSYYTFPWLSICSPHSSFLLLVPLQCPLFSALLQHLSHSIYFPCIHLHSRFLRIAFISNVLEAKYPPCMCFLYSLLDIRCSDFFSFYPNTFWFGV